MKVAYWPGCVSRGFTPELHGSVAKIAPLLDLELVELDRANCCGAGVIAEHNQELADTLNARTFAMAQKVDGAMGVMNICSTCQGAQSECQERLRDLAEDPHGLYDCTHCFQCIEVCPKEVAPMSQIMRLRRRATGDYGIKDRNNGYGHEKAFTDLIETYGTLHEAQLLPRSYGEGSFIRANLSPQGQKNLVPALPTALRGLTSGKVSPLKVIHHPKLPDQKEVKRIYKEIESKDERLELNLYIVGESGGEEEGAMAEGSQES